MKSRKVSRRQALGTMGAASAALVLGCGGSPSAPSAASAAPESSSTNGSCAVTPTETAGPFPSLNNLFRSDIREGKSGTLLTLTIKVVNSNAGCAAVPNADVEIWHVDAAGQVLRVRLAGRANVSPWHPDHQRQRRGDVHDDLPGWYQGRATHIHAEVTIGGVSRKVTADRVSRGRQRRRAYERRVRIAWKEPDDQPCGWHLRRQPRFGAGRPDRRRGERLRGSLPGGDRGMMPISRPTDVVRSACWFPRHHRGCLHACAGTSG